MKSRIVVIALFGLAAFAAVEAGPAQGRMPQGPTDLAGRPGVFKFMTDEEVRAKHLEISELRAAVDRMRGTMERLAARDPQTQRQLDADLQMFATHLGRDEQRMETSVSPTAALAEQRLTAMKGTRSCGICHAGGPVTRSDF